MHENHIRILRGDVAITVVEAMAAAAGRAHQRWPEQSLLPHAFSIFSRDA
jgi:hypothetical protein